MPNINRRRNRSDQPPTQPGGECKCPACPLRKQIASLREAVVRKAAAMEDLLSEIVDELAQIDALQALMDGIVAGTFVPLHIID